MYHYKNYALMTIPVVLGLQHIYFDCFRMPASALAMILTNHNLLRHKTMATHKNECHFVNFSLIGVLKNWLGWLSKSGLGTFQKAKMSEFQQGD
jgi:hypothetical protein